MINAVPLYSPSLIRIIDRTDLDRGLLTHESLPSPHYNIYSLHELRNQLLVVKHLVSSYWAPLDRAAPETNPDSCTREEDQSNRCPAVLQVAETGQLQLRKQEEDCAMRILTMIGPRT